MSVNLAMLPDAERLQVQHDYEAALWAHKVKFGKVTRDEVMAQILQKPSAYHGYLQQRFQHYLMMQVKNR